jgi:hypothetical protein
MESALLDSQPAAHALPLDARIAAFAAAVLGEAEVYWQYRKRLSDRVPLIDGSAAHVIERLAQKFGLEIEANEKEWRIVESA